MTQIEKYERQRKYRDRQKDSGRSTVAIMMTEDEAKEVRDFLKYLRSEVKV